MPSPPPCWTNSCSAGRKPKRAAWDLSPDVTTACDLPLGGMREARGACLPALPMRRTVRRVKLLSISSFHSDCLGRRFAKVSARLERSPAAYFSWSVNALLVFGARNDLVVDEIEVFQSTHGPLSRYIVTYALSLCVGAVPPKFGLH